MLNLKKMLKIFQKSNNYLRIKIEPLLIYSIYLYTFITYFIIIIIIT